MSDLVCEIFSGKISDFPEIPQSLLRPGRSGAIRLEGDCQQSHAYVPGADKFEGLAHRDAWHARGSTLTDVGQFEVERPHNAPPGVLLKR